MLRTYGSHKGQKGQVVLIAAIAMIPMIGLMGLVTDLGYMRYVKSSAQAAADSAVMAAVIRFHSEVGGSTFTCDLPGVVCTSSFQCPPNLTTASNLVETACLYAKQNGFRATGNQNVLITTNVGSTPPPTASGLNSAAFWVTARVSQRVPQLFSAIVGNTTGLVAARATAAVTPAKDCVYVLDPTADSAYYQNGNTTFNMACGMYVNSSSSTAMTNSGGASTLTAPEYDLVGNYDWHGTLTPAPNTGAPMTPDPLQSLPAPSPCSSTGGCELADCSAHPSRVTVNSDTTLSPGTYCGGIYVKHGVATFASGRYIIVGGGIATQDTNSIIRGTGVTFYNTYSSTQAYGATNFAANSDVQLSAPTSGTYSGILFMQDRNCCSTMPTESFQGGANAKFEGTLYFPKSLLEFSGNPTLATARYTLIVVRRLSVQGDSSVNNDYSLLTGGSPIQQVGLVE